MRARYNSVLHVYVFAWKKCNCSVYNHEYDLLYCSVIISDALTTDIYIQLDFYLID